MFETRLTRLRKFMEEKDIPAFLVNSAVNRAYLSGFAGTAGTLLVVPEEAVLFVDFRYTEQAKEQAPHCRIVEHGLDVKKEIYEYLHSHGIRRIFFEKDHVTYGAYLEYKKAWQGIELCAADGLPERLREIKDEHELEIMREAAKLADEPVVGDGGGEGRPGRTRHRGSWPGPGSSLSIRRGSRRRT